MLGSLVGDRLYDPAGHPTISLAVSALELDVEGQVEKPPGIGRGYVWEVTMTDTRSAPRYAAEIVAGLKEAGVSVVAALPDSLLKEAYRAFARDSGLRYVLVANEAEMPGICAGAYLGGMRAVMVMENSGLRQACEPLTRLSWAHHVPLVVIVSHRGEFGERYWWGHNHSQVMEPLLEALRFPYWYVREFDEIKPAVTKAWAHADSGQWPVVLIFGGDCVEVFGHAKD